MEVCCEPAVYVKAKRVEASRATLRLTRLDQLRNYYYPSLLFYQGKVGPDDGTTVLQAVRRGLEAMVEHYPWAAGRLHMVKKLHTLLDGKQEEQECLEVCINEDGGPGVQLIGARVNKPLHSLGDLLDPNPAFEPLFAKVDESIPYPSRPLISLQVSIFECGGFCVSMNSNHVLFDGYAASMFLRNMGSCARKRGMCLPLDLAPRETRIYPHNPPTLTFPPPLSYSHRKNCKPFIGKQILFSKALLATRILYSKEDIAKLRSHALSKQEGCKRGFQACSRFEVITAHLWRTKARCLMALHEDPSQDLFLYTGMNMRERFMASIPRNYVGNAVGVITPSASLKDLNEKSLSFIVEIIQDALKDMTIEHFQSDVEHLEILGSNACKAIPLGLPPLEIPSLANLGFHDIDFGWGKPTHFTLHFKQGRNLVHIMDGDAHRTSLNVFVAFDCEDECLIFQEALKWELSH